MFPVSVKLETFKTFTYTLASTLWLWYRIRCDGKARRVGLCECAGVWDLLVVVRWRGRRAQCFISAETVLLVLSFSLHCIPICSR